MNEQNKIPAESSAPALSVVAGSALSRLSPQARAFHDEYWIWLWQGNDSHRLIGEKKSELRAKYGDDAWSELLNALRADGFLKPNVASETRRGQGPESKDGQ